MKLNPLKYIAMALLAVGLLWPAAASADEVPTLCYGYAPRNPAATDVSAHGTGMNNFIEGAICLNTAADPLLKRLEGCRVVGIRCYLRAEYRQKTKRYSSVWLRQGDLKNAPAAIQYVNFTEGWNELYFDSPATLGSEPLYVGLQVFETKGSPYPLVSYSKASVNDGFFINMSQEGFVEYTSRGTLLIEAIIETGDHEITTNAFVQASDWPRAIAPDSPFDCNLYIRNQGSEPISSLEVTTTSDAGQTTHAYTIPLGEPIPAFDSAFLPYTLTAPRTEGESEEMQLQVTAINGQPTADGKRNSVRLYVSEDAFIRIPLIEEFTGQTCVNCPFMAYYLDQAIEDFGPNHVYVAHHAGFQDDLLTTQTDRDMLYLFGGPTYNPAVMFDRRVLSGNAMPVISAKEPSAEPYKLYLEEVMGFPAKAGVQVEISQADGKLGCNVHGKIAKAMVESADNIYLSAYMIENDIKAEGKYVQNGINTNVADGAPDDLVEKFRHNGVIRIVYNKSSLGDKIVIDENGNFDMTFDAKKLNADWKTENCQVVAFVHKINKEDAEDNFVLNAGFRHLVEPDHSAVESAEPDNLRIYIDANGRPRCNQPIASLQAYDLRGAAASHLHRGIYLVRVKTLGGKVVTRKISL